MEADLDVIPEDDGSYTINNETYISKNLVYRDYQ